MADEAATSQDLRIISLNCWGLKFISKYRRERLSAIGTHLAIISPSPHIVGLQEIWTQEDYLAIREATKHVLPYGKFYWSGIFGGGLAILSQWPIQESNMFRYPLNGRPAAFWRGDWYVGKGVASARVRVEGGTVMEIFNTHLHAPYEAEGNDSYLCHRTAQAWEIAKAMRHARERGHLVLGLGDFNMLPLSLAHRLIEAHGGVRDVWRILYPDSAIGAAENEVEKARGKPIPTVRQCVEEHGATCDSHLNTWRWSKQMQKDLDRGKDSHVDMDAHDVRAKRLDYVFFAPPRDEEWNVASVNVGFMHRHPKLQCSFSDHFSIEATLRQTSRSQATPTPKSEIVSPLPLETYTDILSLISSYMLRERAQRGWREQHFFASILISIACLVAVWWSPHNYVAFILMLVSTLNLAAGVLDGLMGFLFVKSELRALKEFQWEIEAAKERAQDIQRKSQAKEQEGG